MKPYYYLAAIIIFLICSVAQGQQDVDFHLSNQFLQGKQVLKVKRDFRDPYLWVLAKNNEVYRINSVTLAVDNYTPQFVAYNNLQFVDIAGRSQDTVFIATKSTNVIEYEKGVMKLIGSADGIPGTVNSVGIDMYQYHAGNYIGNCLMIGTDNGFLRYNIDQEKLAEPVHDGPSKIYEATYRKFMYKDSSAAYADYLGIDTVHYLPEVYPVWTAGDDIGFLWEGGKTFGYNINTAYYILADIMPGVRDDVDYSNMLWGNNRGLFQNNTNWSYSANQAYMHYLNNINVTKITSIYGLVAFGDNGYAGHSGMLRENLLIGTDIGLYVSSSIYNALFVPGTFTHALRQFSLFHYNELGNFRVNDICVNAASTSMPVCEDGVWVACDDGLYLLRPDYSKSLNGAKVQAISFDNQPDSIKICAGTSVTAYKSQAIYNTIGIQWYKNGEELPGMSKDQLVINTSGDYYAVLYDPCENVHLESNHLNVQVISSPVFTFNYPDKLQYCDSTSTTLKTDYDAAYHYRWYTNGTLNGDTSYNYTVTQSGKYKVEVSACSNSWIPSKEIEVDLIDLPVPLITADKAKYCAGDTAKLSLNVPSDAGYTISWFKDGSLITAAQNQADLSVTDNGSYSVTLSSTISNCTKTSNTQQIAFTPSPVFTLNYPDKLVYCSGTPVTLRVTGSHAYHYRWYTNGVLNGDTSLTAGITQSGSYKVEVSACENSWVTSKIVQVDLIDIPVPAIQTDQPAYCIGDNATLSVQVPVNPDYTINWYKDNVLRSANTNQSSIQTNINGSYSVVIVSNETNTDGTVCIQKSQSQNIVFNPPPVVSIQKMVSGTLCDGQTVTLQVSYDNGTAKWNTGETSDQISVSTSGTYTATVTSAAGCMTDTSIYVQFYPNPILDLPNVGVCVPSGKTATLTAPAGMVSYVWNGQQGQQTFMVDHPQTVTLTVTDANGCQATQQIQVKDDCPNINIPNTFTPNGDGVNDTWDIQGLEYDATALVKIFTRNGQQIYQSRGYTIPWNGTYQDKKLPAGVYYYIITAKNGSQTYSGSVTIIY